MTHSTNRLLPLVVALLLSWGALAQECTPQWDYLLDTDPTHPKTIEGDTHAAYASFSFWGDPSKKFVLQGVFPHARFMSLESNETRWGLKGDALFDFNMQPDAGSSNPFVIGTLLDVPDRSYTIEVLADGVASNAPNQVRLRQGTLQKSLLFRIYSPNPGVVLDTSAVPRIFAYDVDTGLPTSCPVNAPVKQTLDLPQALTDFVRHQTQFGFINVQIPWGPNSAIPYYLGAADRINPDEMAIFHFKAPTSVSTSGGGVFTDEGEVRYWSLCSSNLVKLITLNCVPDSAARVDAQGFVTIVYGRGDDVRAAAEARGATFLEDTRDASQPVAEFAYRNVLPQADFAATSMYQGDYRPQGTLCTHDAYLNGSCGF